MRLLMAPRAAERRWRTSAQGSSSFRARRALSSWPMTFLVRLTRSNFSREECDILIVYPMGVWYQGFTRFDNGALNNKQRGRGVQQAALSARRVAPRAIFHG